MFLPNDAPFKKWLRKNIPHGETSPENTVFFLVIKQSKNLYNGVFLPNSAS
jgi:hypothetical protein